MPSCSQWPLLVSDHLLYATTLQITIWNSVILLYQKCVCDCKQFLSECDQFLGQKFVIFAACSFLFPVSDHFAWSWIIIYLPTLRHDAWVSCLQTKDIDLTHYLFQSVKYKVSTAHHMEGDIGGYPIPQYRKKNWQIPKCCVKNQWNTDTAFMIAHVYLKLYPSGMFVYLCMHQKSTSDIARKREKTLIGRMIEKPSHWTPFQFHHRLCNQ